MGDELRNKEILYFLIQTKMVGYLEAQKVWQDGNFNKMFKRVWKLKNVA